MENVYEKIVKLTAEILKSWKSNPGVVSPFSSSSSQHTEENDNHLEYYVPTPSDKQTPDVSSIFNSDLFTNGGEKMTETTQDPYVNPGSATTEPDPQSEIAITKSAEVSTTEVSTIEKATTEDSSDEDTEDSMESAANCPNCGQAMPIAKAADEPESATEEAHETPADEEKEKQEVKKSLWAGAFAPSTLGKL